MIKEVKGFPDYYLDTNGNLYSTKGKTFRKLKYRSDKDGYFKACLFKNGKGFNRFVHRLMYETFIDNIPNGILVCHRDDIKSNNTLKNLKLGNHKMNMKDRKKNGVSYEGVNNPNVKLNEFIVRVIRKLIKLKTLTNKEIGKIFDVSDVCISLIKRNKIWINL